MKRQLSGLLFSILVLTGLVLAGCTSNDAPVKHDLAISSDSERIAYSTCGEGETSLIFIHGWCCDSRYWQSQVSVFAKKYRVIAIDLAGHGNSSSGRLDYTMLSFARDVKAVIEKEKINKAILIGHSLGGGVIAEAARLMPEKVVAIIGVDTLHDAAEVIPQKVIDDMSQPFEVDFPKAMHSFVLPMFPKETNAELTRWVKEDMSSAPPKAAVSAFRNFMGQYVNGEARDVLKNITIPVVSINARLWPTNEDANSKLIKAYKPYYIEGTGHFPMLEKSEEFNRLLTEALLYIEAPKNQGI